MPTPSSTFIVPRMRLVELAETRLRRSIVGVGSGTRVTDALTEPIAAQAQRLMGRDLWGVGHTAAFAAIGSADNEVFFDVTACLTVMSVGEIVQLTYGR